MTSAATSSALSGAASGAVLGSQILPGWGTVIGGVIGGVAGLISGSAADADQKNASAWAIYNNNMKLKTDLYNIDSETMLSNFNAASVMLSGNLAASSIKATADYNAAMTYFTTLHTDDLLEQELTQVWQDSNLDLTQLEQFKLREQGALVASQAASGTVIGSGSNAEAVIDQNTQRAIDSEVIMFNADRKAADISNEKAASLWKGQVAIDQILWEGQLQSYNTKANAAIQAGTIGLTNRIRSKANTYTAYQNYNAGSNAVTVANSRFSSQQTQALVKGLFKAAASYGVGAYASKLSTVASEAPKYINAGTASYSNANLALSTRFTGSGAGTSLILG